MIQVNKPTAAMPPSITAGGIGAAVMVSHRAGILRADVTMDKELGGFHIPLFGDVFADFD
jgi:hypothetical protein